MYNYQVRVIEETKNELHERAGDLQNSLWELADAQVQHTAIAIATHCNTLTICKIASGSLPTLR